MSAVYVAFEGKYGAAVTLHDTADNIKNARYLHNNGTGGILRVRQDSSLASGLATVDVYLAQGSAISCLLSWRGAQTTGTTAGVSIVAIY